MKINSLRIRLTLLFVAIFGTTLIGLSVAGYRFFVRAQQADFDRQLLNHASDVASGVSVDFFGKLVILPLTAADENKSLPFPLERNFRQLRDIEGRIIARSANLLSYELPLNEKELRLIKQVEVTFNTLPSKSLPVSISRKTSSYRLVNYLIRKPGVPLLILQLAAPLTYLERVNTDLFRFLLLGIPAILIFATLCGFYVSRRALAPVKGMIAKTEQIGVGQLSERVPLPNTHDEIEQLARTFNKLLDRVETSVLSNERFVSNASHQLKTPLAILKGELEILLSRNRSEQETQDFLKSAKQEIDTLTHLIENLLVLARVDAGSQSIQMGRERLDELLIEVMSRLEPLARSKSITTKLALKSTDPMVATPSFELEGDSELLKTMMQSIVENAVKYSPVGSVIEIILQEGDSELAVQIKDQGPGISTEDLPNLFDRFYRSRSNKSDEAGFGLGLAIAKRIAELHGGYIEVKSTPGEGATFIAHVKKHNFQEIKIN